MAKLPPAVAEALDGRKAPAVFATVDTNGIPNAIYASCVYKYDAENVIVADNFFNKTRANIKSGSWGTLVFITEKGQSYQIKGPIEYATEGPQFDFMKKRVNESLPGHAAAVIKVGEVYSGAEKLA